MKKLILGAGISGLVLAECFKQNGVPDEDIVIIGKVSLGQQSYSFNLGPRILHKTEKVLRFLKNMNIKDEPKNFHIGYVKNGEVLENVSLEDKKFYALKNGKALEKSTLSGSKTNILGWDLKETNLAEILLERHKNKIINYNLSKNEIESLKKEFEEVYCTFPLKEVNDSFIGSLNYITYVYTNEDFKYRDKAYVYDLSDNKIKRVSNFKGKAVYECIGALTLKEAEKLIKGDSQKKVEVLDMVQMKTTISKEEKVDSFNGMIMVGRFATNNHSERIDTIIEKFLGEL